MSRDILEEISLGEPGTGLKELHSLMAICNMLYHFENGRRVTISTEYVANPIW